MGFCANTSNQKPSPNPLGARESRVGPHSVPEGEEVERGEDEDEVDGPREQANPESRVRMFFPHREQARSGISEMIHHHAHRGDGGDAFIINGPCDKMNPWCVLKAAWSQPVEVRSG